MKLPLFIAAWIAAAGLGMKYLEAVRDVFGNGRGDVRRLKN